MKRGGHRLIVSILCIAMSFMVSVGIINHVAYAVEPDTSTTTTEQTNDADDTDGAESTDEEPTAETTNDSCEAGFFGFGWLICPGQNLITTIFSHFFNMIADSLEWTFLAENTDVMLDVWQDFLNIANIVFAITFLIMIYSMATSMGLKAYDVRRMLPRIVVLAIAVNLSFYICAALVDVSNITGQGVYDILISRTTSGNLDTLNVNVAASIFGVVGGAIAIIFLGGAAIVGLIIILLAVTFRQVALVVLTIISPIAFALYTLPNTEKWGKQWMNTFVSMLMVYPMFMLVWGASQLVANIVATTDPNGGISVGAFVTNILCSVAPAFAIMPLFKKSGALLGGVVGAMAGSSIAKKSNAAISSAIKRSPPASAGRRGLSNAALGIQNTFGDVPIIGGLARSRAVSSVANINSDFVAQQDKKALDAATTWVGGLSSSQLSDLVTTGGSYTDNKNRRVTVTDTYKMRAAIGAAQNILTASDWHKAMKATNARALQLERNHRSVEASQLRNTFANTAIASKAMTIGPGAISKFGNGSFDYNHFDAEYGSAVAGYATNLSQDKLSKLPDAAVTDMRSAMYTGMSASALAGLTSDKVDSLRNDFDKGAEALRNKSGSTLNDRRTAINLSGKAKNELEYTRDNMRTISQQDIANSYNLDSLFQDYSSGYTKLNKAIKSGITADITAATNELNTIAGTANSTVGRMQASGDWNNITSSDRQRLDDIRRYTPGSAPTPIKSW